MKRIRLLLPLLGLALLLAAVVSRSFQAVGLELEPFPRPPAIDLPPVDVSLGDARLAGFVRSAEGRGVGQAVVKVLLGDEPAWTYTDEDGHFALEHVPPGPHQVHVWTRRFHHAEFEAVAPAEELLFTLVEPFDPLPELPLLERADLRGRVVAAMGGQVLAGYEVLLRPVVGVDTLGAPVERRAPVAGDRSFELPDLLLGEYRVAVLPPWARGGNWPDLGAPEGRAFQHTRLAAESGIEIALAAGEIRVRLADQEGLAVGGALVLVHPADRPGRPWPAATTDASGAALVADLPPGRYRVEALAGEAQVEASIEVVAGATLEVDLPPLALRAPEDP